MHIPTFILDLSIFSVYPNQSYLNKNNVNGSYQIQVRSELFDNHLKRYKLSKQVQSSLDKILSKSKSPVKPDSDSKEIVNNDLPNKTIRKNSIKTKEKFEIIATVSRDVIPLSWKQSLVYLVTCNSGASHALTNEASKLNSIKFSQLSTLLVEIEKHLLVNYNGNLALIQPLTNNLATLTILKPVFFKPLTTALFNKHHLQKSSLYHIYLAATKYKTKSANGLKDNDTISSIPSTLSQTQSSISKFIQSTGKAKRKHSEDGASNTIKESNNDTHGCVKNNDKNVVEDKTKRMRMTKEVEGDNKEPEMMQKLRLMVERRRSSSRLFLQRSSSNLVPNSGVLMEDSSSCFPSQAFFNDDNTQLSPCKTSQLSSQPAATIPHTEDEDDVCFYDFTTEKDLVEYCEKCSEKAIEGDVNVMVAARRSIRSILKHYSLNSESNVSNISSNGGIADTSNKPWQDVIKHDEKVSESVDNENEDYNVNDKDDINEVMKPDEVKIRLDQKLNDEDSDLAEKSFNKSKAYEMLEKHLIRNAKEVKGNLLNEKDDGMLIRGHEWQIYLHCELHHQLQTRITFLVPLHAQEICKHLRSISFIKDNSYVSSLVDVTLCELYQQTCGRLMYRIYDELILPIPAPLRHLLSPDKFDHDSLLSPIKHKGAARSVTNSVGGKDDEVDDKECVHNEENTSVKSDSRNNSLNSGDKADGIDGCERRKDKTKALYSLFNYKNGIPQKDKSQPSPSTSKSKSRALNRSISFSQKTLKIDMNSSRLISLKNPSYPQDQLRRHHRHRGAHKTPSRSRKSHHVLKTKRARETPEYKQGIDRYALKRKEVLSQSCMGDVPLEVQETPIKDQLVSGDGTLRRRTSFYSSQPLTRLSSAIPNPDSIVSSSKISPAPKVEFFSQIDINHLSHSNQGFNNLKTATFKNNLAPNNEVEALLNLASEKIAFLKASPNKKPKSIFASLVSSDNSKSPQINKNDINKENTNKSEIDKRIKTDRFLFSFINDSSNSSNSKSIGVYKGVINGSVKPQVSTPVRRITRNIFASHSNSSNSQSSVIVAKSGKAVGSADNYKNLAINNNSNISVKTAATKVKTYDTSARKKRKPIEALIDENANDGGMMSMSTTTFNKAGHHFANSKVLFADHTNSSCDADKSTSISFKHFTRGSVTHNNPQASAEKHKSHKNINQDLDAILMRSPSTRRSILQARRALLTSPEHKNTRSVKKLWA